MMTIREVLAGAGLLAELADEVGGTSVAGLEYDSRRVEKDFLFFAFPGAKVDGRSFAQQALDKGAVATVSELPRPDGFAGEWIQVEHGRRALATASRNFYAKVDERIQFTGITGTNGKTTTAYLVDALLRSTGKTTAMIGTIEYRMADQVRGAANTTPESLDVFRMAAELERLGGTHFTMEVSSHALALARVYGMRFHTAVFTNLTRDHLDFHGTMEEYAAAKRMLFIPTEDPAPKWAVLNADDAASEGMAPAAGSATRVIRYGLSEGSDLRAKEIRSGFDGLHFEVTYEGKKQAMASPMIGRINVSNILAATGVGLSYGLELETIAEGIRQCAAVPGRFERVDCGQPFLVAVDYAHTDDALRNIIQVARGLTSKRVITVFGCGGDRDRTKRPLMGMAAAELSDLVVLTSDNPRSEDPIDIMNDVMVGLRRFDTACVFEPDRAKAIHTALGAAKAGDIVLLAGKGHETYQILKDQTVHFDDRETAREILRSLGYGHGA
ncbi:MAG: UDP-N-acetylmuramoyl-L-alanyl-D-glutamate--2,6-diaminopimelate ligase [Bryobacteraceae bacterium]